MPAATIFIVDDDALLRLSLRDRFGREGYDLVEAGSCAEATARLTPEVDLVLLDFQLPDGDGLSVLRHIKEKSPDTIVILMTAYSSVPNAVEAMKLGAFHYINKPFDVEEIVLLAEKALETTRNTIERAMLLTTHEWIEPDDLQLSRPSKVTARFQLPSEGINMEEVERQLLEQALERSHGNQSQAAQLLGLNRDQVRYRIEKFGLQV
jgi:DNA-binding NtrC family response regulator